jgi:hypothetical protein
VDTLSLTAPATLPVGTSTTVTATLTQGSRSVPVAYPVTADWTASPNVHLGDARGLRPWHTAWFDPDTGRLVALRRSTVTLAVTVNGVTQPTTIQLAAPGAGTPAACLAAAC